MALNANSEVLLFRARKRRHSFTTRRRIVLVLARFVLRQKPETAPVVVLSNTGTELPTLTQLIEHTAHLSRISERTIWRWYRAFLRSGFAGLRSEKRRDAGVSRSFDRRGLAICFALDKRADGWTVRQICNGVGLLWPRLYRDGSRPPCYWSGRNFLGKAERP